MPGDKSMTHRALMLAAIADGETRIVCANLGADVFSTVRALRRFGVTIGRDGDGFIVRPPAKLRSPRGEIDCGNSGTTMRLLAGLLAGRVRAVLEGDASLRRRPMARVSQPLALLGADIRTARGGRPPLRIEGKNSLTGARVKLAVPSAQVKSALLLAALGASGPTTIIQTHSTRDHTERMLRAFGARISARGRTIVVQPSSLASPGRVEIFGDFSAAMFFMSAAAVLPGARLRLNNVGINPTRAAALRVLQSMGAHIAVHHRRLLGGEPVADLTVTGGHPLHAVRVAGRLVPNLIDEIPVLSAVAAAARGIFTVRGARELRHKESDRIHTVVTLLRRFGVDARALPDGIVVRGGAPLRAPRSISTFGDHRIGMTAAVLATAAQTALVIDDAECIATSFPGFKKAWASAFSPME